MGVVLGFKVRARSPEPKGEGSCRLPGRGLEKAYSDPSRKSPRCRQFVRLYPSLVIDDLQGGRADRFTASRAGAYNAY